MGRIFFGVAVLFFFLAAIGAHVIPHAGEWGMVSLALGFAVGGWTWTPWKKSGA